jgi:hypothetical protein
MPTLHAASASSLRTWCARHEPYMRARGSTESRPEFHEEPRAVPFAWLLISTCAPYASYQLLPNPSLTSLRKKLQVETCRAGDEARPSFPFLRRLVAAASYAKDRDPHILLFAFGLSARRWSKCWFRPSPLLPHIPTEPPRTCSQVSPANKSS